MHHNSNRNWHNQPNQQNWHQQPNRRFEENDMQDNYDYGNYTSDFRNDRHFNQRQNQNPNRQFGSYEGAPSGYQQHHPNNPNPYDGMHGYNNYGYAGGNPGFESAAGEFRGNDWPEANTGFGVGTGRSYDSYEPQFRRQRDMDNDYRGRSEQRGHNRNMSARPKGQTMDSWDNDYNHWHSEKYGRGGFDMEENNQEEFENYRPQNQGYFGGNMSRHSGGNLYNERFRNDDNFAGYNSREDRWHADSLSDRNIEGWGR